MKNTKLHFDCKTAFMALLLTLCVATAQAATTCSRANLTRCLDSACAINVSTNPAARCQYCGTSGAGTPPTDNGMRSVSVGSSAKYNISAKDLKKAPDDPGERYAWATAQCIKKVTGCTADDVSETYDSLIEQSCKAAGISAEMANLAKAAKKAKTQSACQSEVKSCLIKDNKCTGDYRACGENADFDKFFAECSVAATGCDAYLADIRTKLSTDRDNAIKNAEANITNLAASYKSARDKKLADIKSGCADNGTRDACVETVCESNMINKCAPGFEAEKSMAILLCKFYEVACGTIK